MHSLSLQDWRQLERAFAALYAPGLSPENYLARGFAALRAMVAADLYAYGQRRLKPDTLEISLSETPPGAAAALQALSQSMWKYRLHNWDPTVNDGRPFNRGDFFSRRQYRDTDVFADTMKPLGLCDHFAVLVPGQPGEVVFFGVERGGRTEFTERDRAVLALLQEHLANARQLAQQQAKTPELCPENVLPQLRRAGLSAREAEVLYWMLEGKTNEEAAVILGLRTTTVKSHAKSIFIKLGVENRLAAVRCALRLALAPEPIRHPGPSIAFVGNGRPEDKSRKR